MIRRSTVRAKSGSASRTPLSRRQQRTVARTLRELHSRQLMITISLPRSRWAVGLWVGSAVLAVLLIIAVGAVPWLVGVLDLLQR